MRSIEESVEREVRTHMAAPLARDPEVSRALFRKAAELGLFQAEVPEEDRGLDLSMLAIMGMMSSRAHVGPLSQTIVGHQGIAASFRSSTSPPRSRRPAT